MSPQFVQIPNMVLWSQSIGGLIINFGVIEFQSLLWIHKLGGETAALKARRDKLSRRIEKAVSLIASPPFSTAHESRALALGLRRASILKLAIGLHTIPSASVGTRKPTKLPLVSSI